MKKFYTLSLLLLGVATSFAQTFYSENFGTPSSNTPASDYTGYQNTAPIMYTGNATARTTAASSGYTGATGSGNIYFGTNGTYTFMVEGINTSSYSTADLVFTFGQLQQNASDTTDDNLMLEVSTNGTDFTMLEYSRTNSTGWELITVDGGVIPSTTNLRIRFTQTSTIQYRIDDLALSSVSASCLLSLGDVMKECNTSTLSTNDTYTITIPFTGGGTETYNITSSEGTIGGDSPSSMAEGNIVITDVTEGMNADIAVIGGTCNLTVNVIGISCKPINTLPYGDSFDYATGALLGDQQMWTAANSGDDIVVVEDNLTYPGLTSAGNAIAFSGAGKEGYTPFTPTTEGTIYTSFLMKVTDLSNVTTDGSFTYFAVMAGEAPSDYNARLYWKLVGSQYQLGLDDATSTENYTTTSYDVNETVMVIMGFDYSNNMLMAWINPTLATLTASTPPTLSKTLDTAPQDPFAGFLIRQDNDTRTPSITFDELRVFTQISELMSVRETVASEFAIYPNPLTGNTLNITSANGAQMNVAVYDVLGKQVINTKTVNGTINASGLPSGVYIVKITYGAATATRNLVVK